jgi:hypothetical protein
MLEYYLSIIYGVAEHWVNLRINIFNVNNKHNLHNKIITWFIIKAVVIDIPSDNADTSNEKEEVNIR